MSVEEYKVYSGVPLPAAKRGGVRPSKYKFADLEIGDMFFVPNPPKTFRSQVTAAGRRLGRKFAVRDVVVEGVTGVGCWRLPPAPAKADTSVPADVEDGDDE
jgi:hypothetical protein